jgi:hypothetical protein
VARKIQEAENYCSNKYEKLSVTVHTVYVECLVTRKAKKDIYKYGGRVRDEETGSVPIGSSRERRCTAGRISLGGGA